MKPLTGRLLASILAAVLLPYCASSTYDPGDDDDNNNDDDDNDDGAADGDADSDADADADADSDSDADGDTDSDADGDTDSDADGDADSDADSDTDSDADADADADSDSDADSDADADADADSDSDGDCLGTPLVSQLATEDGLGPLITTLYLAQSFVPYAGTLNAVRLYLDEPNAELGPHTVQIRGSTTTAGPPPGCVVTTSPGCGGCACESCVCGMDPYCCNTAWDEYCVEECQYDCGMSCSGTIQVPSSAVLATATVDAIYDGSSGTYDPYCLPIGPLAVTSGSKYWIVMVPNASVSSTQTCYWGLSYNASSYPAGENRYSENSGGTWLDLASAGYGGDFAFQVFGY